MTYRAPVIDDDLADTTSKVRALDADGDTISERICTKSREMRAFHRDYRERMASSDPPPSKGGLSDPTSTG